MDGSFDLNHDVVQGALLDYEAVLSWDGNPIDTFYTQITAGNPELYFQSVLITDSVIPGSTSGSGRIAPPAEGVIGIAPGIRESAVVNCPRTASAPLPMLLHFFSSFAVRHQDELVRDRGG